jgi:uncharacterized protein
MLILIATFSIGIISGFLGASVGNGGLLSIPFLIFIGLPPQIAVATNRMGSIGLSIGALTKFMRADKILWNYVPIFVLMSLVGGLIGANLLITIDTGILSSVIALIILVMVGLMFLKPTLGVERNKMSKLMMVAGYFCYLLVMVYSGFFGAGTGTLAIYTLMGLFGLRIIEANATDFIPWTVVSIISLGLFMYEGIVDYKVGLTLLIGMMIGGYIGAHVSIKKGDAWVKKFFGIVVFISAIKLLFF